jgi:hypothetical protein
MNAMLDARMVATSIQLLAFATHGIPSAPERIAASSQGDLMSAIDAFGAD